MTETRVEPCGEKERTRKPQPKQQRGRPAAREEERGLYSRGFWPHIRLHFHEKSAIFREINFTKIFVKIISRKISTDLNTNKEYILKDLILVNQKFLDDSGRNQFLQHLLYIHIVPGYILKNLKKNIFITENNCIM